MCAGQGHRQLDQPQGRRGSVHRAGQALSRLRRGGHRHGLRRAGPGGHGRAQGRDLRTLLPRADRQSRFRPRRHHLRPEHLRRGHRHRGTRELRHRLHRGDPTDQSVASARARERRCQQRVVLVPRQQRRPGSDSLGVPVPRDSGRHGHGDRQCRPARDLRGPPRRTARRGRGRHPQPRVRRYRPAAGRRRELQGPGEQRRCERSGPFLARAAGRAATAACAGERHRRVRRRRHRGGAPGGRAAAGRHRGAADGRHERRRRPVRRRQDVPAAGRQVGARDEEGRGSPRAVHRAGTGRRLPQQRPHRARHGQGRRARHRQEHRRRRAAVQQLRGDRPRRHGVLRPHTRGRRARKRQHHRPVRPDYPVARRDGARRERNAAAQVRPAAPDRRRDDVAGAHGREDRAVLRRAGHLRQGCIAFRRRRAGAGRTRNPQGHRRKDAARQRAPPRAACRQEAPGATAVAVGSAQARARHRLGRL